MKEVENLYVEKVTFPPKNTFEMAKDSKEKKKPAFVGKNTGPENADGFKKEASDPKDIAGKETFQGTEKFSSQNFNENNEKIEQKEINNFMSKSIFDKLFEDVMGDASASQDEQDAVDLGLDVGGEAGTEEGGEVTFTLPRDVAQQLHDVLMTALGGGEEAPAGGEEAAGGEEEKEEENQEVAGSEDAEHKAKEDKKEDKKEEVAGEATHLEALPDSKGQTLAGKNNKVGGTVDSLVAKGHGDGKVKGEIEAKGKDLPDSAGAKLQSKNNKVANKHNVGDYLFKK
ncbi:hypothetical protein EBU95_11415 [bacterium]|nr:hypothetical protein [bacterium]